MNPIWQPIDTAPRGTSIIVWDPYFLVRAARFDHLRNAWVVDAPYSPEDHEHELEPTHWFPVPLPVPSEVAGGTATAGEALHVAGVN